MERFFSIANHLWEKDHVCVCADACTCMCSVVSDCNPMDCSLPGSSACGILQARLLEWVAIFSSRESSQPRDQLYVSCIAGRFFTTEPPGKPQGKDLTRKKKEQRQVSRVFQSPLTACSVPWNPSVQAALYPPASLGPVFCLVYLLFIFPFYNVVSMSCCICLFHHTYCYP